MYSHTEMIKESFPLSLVFSGIMLLMIGIIFQETWSGTIGCVIEMIGTVWIVFWDPWDKREAREEKERSFNKNLLTNTMIDIDNFDNQLNTILLISRDIIVHDLCDKDWNEMIAKVKSLRDEVNSIKI